MAWGKTSKCMLEGVLHILKLTTLPSDQRHPSKTLRQGTPYRGLQVGPTPRSTLGHALLLVVSDHFAKFFQAFPVKNTSAVTLAKKVMDEYICRFGSLGVCILIKELMWTVRFN